MRGGAALITYRGVGYQERVFSVAIGPCFRQNGPMSENLFLIVFQLDGF